MKKVYAIRRVAPLTALAGTVALTVSLSCLSTAAHARGYVAATIMSGLANPRGLTIGPDGAVYVTQAGKGGNGPSVIGIANENVSYGATGGVSRWKGGEGQSKVLSGVGSLGDQSTPDPGSGAVGLQDIIFAGGEYYGVMGSPGAVAERDDLNDTDDNGSADTTVGNEFGLLVRLSSGGVFTAPTTLADFVPFETANNPDGGDVNSNPFALIQNGTGFTVVDAGGNTLYNVDSGGSISVGNTFAAKPNPLFPGFGPPVYQPVPTAVAVGPADILFVTELTGFPFPAGDGNIYKVQQGTGIIGLVPDPNNPSGTTSGFSHLIDIAYNSNNNKLYALSYAANFFAPVGGGQLWEVDPVTGERTLIFDGLTTPTGLTLGQNGDIYVTNSGTSPTEGQVLLLRVAVPETGTGLMALAALAPLAGIALARRRRK